MPEHRACANDAVCLEDIHHLLVTLHGVLQGAYLLDGDDHAYKNAGYALIEVAMSRANEAAVELERYMDQERRG